jgi:hypothetical protein
MKLATTIIATLAACSIMAQGFRDNTLDINYNASYRDAFSLRATTRLSELNNWDLRGFSAGAGMRILPGFNITYDISRGHELNANTISRYGFGYQFAKPNFNLNMSLYSVNGTPREDGIHGRIDLSVKFK